MRYLMVGTLLICGGATLQNDLSSVGISEAIDTEPPIIVGGAEPLAMKAGSVIPELPVSRSRSPIRRQIYEVLDRPLDEKGIGGSDLFTEWHDSQLTLEELVESIGRVHGITVYADLQKVKPDKVTITVPPIYGETKPTVGSVLWTLLRYRNSCAHPLGFSVRDDGLLITYLDIVVETGTEFAIYDLSALPQMDEDELCEVLGTTSVKWNWDDNEGGDYSVRKTGKLLVRHTWAAQQEVHKVLSQLAIARATTDAE